MKHKKITHRQNSSEIVRKRERIPKVQSQMDNPEKLEIQVTQDEEKQNNNMTQYVLDTTIRKQHE
jgi:hypothetical protein